jgi:hypothetical protein
MTTAEPARTALARRWSCVAARLDLRVATDVEVKLASGVVVAAVVHLRDFGGPFGILLFTEAEQVMRVSEELVRTGYAFSVLSPPPEGDVDDPANDPSLFEMLRDWGWAGQPIDMPTWMREATRSNGET